MPATKPNIFTIPASAQFLPVLIDALLAGRLVAGFPASKEPLELARATIYLPTRRAARLARDVFLEHTGTEAAILPRILAIGDIDEDEFAFADAASSELAAEALNLPPALSGLERTMPLAALILRWAQTIAPRADGEAPLVATNPATAFALAQQLARLMDDMTMRQVKWERLDELVPEEFDKYWEESLGFLEFIRAAWPGVLSDIGRMEPAERRNILIKAEAARLEKTAGPVIAAGSTGSIPATAELLAKIARLPNGALVLPGLDTDLDDATWATITEEADAAHAHPQYAMAGLLQRTGVSRSDVTVLGNAATHGREGLVSEALRPAAASEQWGARLREAGFAAHADAAMNSIAVIEAASAEEEALAIAVALRETAEAPDKTAALVTPDVALGRRVLAALGRWNVAVDDSRGLALGDTPEGVFARLTAEVALGGVAPVPLLALLKHTSGRFDESGVVALERAILRGPRPSHGCAGLAAALNTFGNERQNFYAKQDSSLHHSDPRLNLRDFELEAAAALIDKLATALAPLEALAPGTHSFAAIARLHAEVVTALGGMTTALAEGFGRIDEAGALPVTLADYSELFRAALAEKKIYRPLTGARVRIYGLLEARLQSVDRLVLGGLAEGIWPPETRGDPWLSRPMRRELGLDLPERRIGLSAHDFAQALGASEVVLSRAAKLEGTPTVASRFVQRLAAVAGETRWKAALEHGARFTALARALDDAAAPKPAERPAPKPPLKARPRRLSVTEIEDLLRDPYTIYAKHVLKLAPLDPIDEPPGAADRGTVIHEAIGEFGKTYADKLPEHPARVLTEIGAKHFKPLAEYPEARAFWWPRFVRIAEWLASFEAKRRANAGSLKVEVGGSIPIPFGNESFALTVRADRIECLADGRFAIIDYKTGAPPSDKQVRSGLAPQLTLEAAILRNGGFKDIAGGGSVKELVYVRLRGGAEAGEAHVVDPDSRSVDEHADHALAELTKVLAQFADATKPYYSLLHPMWSTHYGTYDHLARVKEWSLTGGVDEEGPGA